ncbi:MAG: glycoside hydrolase family 2 TIM barrel-domain containing protein [Verrucomicrobiae bacterium]|nr:glycoside hydrolase family 2 TIM barrel-domain containing protein [Verrucomicrobiae bacterium]
MLDFTKVFVEPANGQSNRYVGDWRMKQSLPRPEHPRPQFERSTWINLNGSWTFAFDPGRSGHEREWHKSRGFDRTILVPFCPESRLSGVGHTDFIDAIWYHRLLEIPAEWRGRKLLLHFGGVDFESEVFIDGQLAGRHYGGSASFAHEITELVRPGEKHHLVVMARDDIRAGLQPGGKQSCRFQSQGCSYTRTTGIWQTVWLEAAPAEGLREVRIVPDLDGGRLVVTPGFHGVRQGLRFQVKAMAGKDEAGRGEVAAMDGNACEVKLQDARPWSPEDPFLYDLQLRVVDRAGVVVDEVKSYAGLRKIHLEGDRVFLNNRPLYQRLVLDQGFYPEGIWTAPGDEALKRDIELSMRAGFNGARLHQKVFEERFHYWADRLGYLTWAESASWGMDVKNPASGRNFLSEWAEIVTRDRNHPSIITWTPLNETNDVGDGRQHRRLHEDLYELTRRLDPTRPVNDSSGYVHVRTDLWTVHNYEQNPVELRKQLTPDAVKGVWRNYPGEEVAYAGQPYLVDEFGGIKWIPAGRQAFASNSWGYGEGPKNEEEFYARLEGQVDALLAVSHVRGYCYTQLTDVEQEQNGIYNYDRTEKFDVKRLARIFGRKPD